MTDFVMLIGEAVVAGLLIAAFHASRARHHAKDRRRNTYARHRLDRTGIPSASNCGTMKCGALAVGRTQGRPGGSCGAGNSLMLLAGGKAPHQGEDIKAGSQARGGGQLAAL